jgi:hypothetical protein
MGSPDKDELMSVVVNAIVDGALSWNPRGGRSITSWCWMYAEKDLQRALQRRYREREELGQDGCLTDRPDDFSYQSGLEAYHRAELRIDLQRWADLAELTDFQRFVVEYAALHKGVYVRDTPLAGQEGPLHGSGAAVFKHAIGHMRKAAETGKRRNDAWTRMRNRGDRDAITDRALETARAKLAGAA